MINKLKLHVLEHVNNEALLFSSERSTVIDLSIFLRRHKELAAGAIIKEIKS